MGTDAEKQPTDLIHAVLDQIDKDFIVKETGFLTDKDGPTDPNSIHIFHPPLFLGAWSVLREIVLVEGKLPRKDKEVLASFVSKGNDCAFCAHTHTLFAESQGNDTAELEKALANKDPSGLSDARMASISEWYLQARKVDPPYKQKAPFPKEECPEIIGTAFYFNYMNRVVDTYITQDIFIPSMPGFLKFFMKMSTAFKGFMNSNMVKKFGLAGRVTTPGESLLLADHDPPLGKEFPWASGNKSIQRAVAYFAWSVDDMVKLYVTENVRNFVSDYIRDNYNGGQPPLSRKWAFTASEELKGTDEEQLAAAFMLLVSFSRFQIDENLKRDVKAAYPDSRTFRAFGMWAALQTAKKSAEILSKNYHKP